jgi:hypothetical protein
MVIALTRKALAEINQPPRLFLRGGLLSRIGSDDDGRMVILQLNPSAIRAELAVHITWLKKKKGQTSPASVPGIAVDDLSTHADQLGGERGIPVLDQIVTAPVFAQDGTLLTTPGYMPSARVWYQPLDGMIVPPVSQQPSREEIVAAGRFLMLEYLGDFPFDGEASRQHALGALLLPFVRLMINGPVPLQCADASTPGTGKGLLQRALMFPALGGMLPALPGVLDDDEELRKKITTSLMRGQQVIRWDNVTQRVDSAVLSSVLTEPVWQDRVLGLNRDVEIPVHAIFLMNGNNLQFSQEIARRAVPSRLDLAKHAGGLKFAEEPWRRAGFRHPELTAWARAQRGNLVHAALTVIQAWIAAGRPAGVRTIGSFEQWARVTGGIVEFAAGGPQWSAFLDGLDDLYADAVTERDEKIVFLETWLERLGDVPVTTQHLIVNLGDVDPWGVMNGGTSRSQETKLGYRLAKMRDQVWGGYQVTKHGRAWTVRRV